MPNYPQVIIEDITDQQDSGKSQTADSRQLGNRVDAKILALSAQALQTQTRARCDRVFKLSWSGDKTPIGAQIGDYEITGTQHGRVIGQKTDGSLHDIGQYDRKKEFGGESGEEHEIIVYFKNPV